MTNGKERLTVYLAPEAARRLRALSERATAKLGRKQGRGAHGRSSLTIEAAIMLVSEDDVLAHQAAAERQAA
jgi:hypothetical protein